MEGQDMTTSKSKKKLSVKEKIRRGPVTESVPVWIGADLDLVNEYDELAVKLIEPAEDHDSNSLAGSSRDTTAIEARMAAIREQLDDYVVEFRVTAVSPKKWSALLAKHQPRVLPDGKPDPRDRVGWNMDTFPSVIIRAGTVTPEFDDDDWVVLLGDDTTDPSLTGGQIDQVAAKVMRLSQHHINLPFSRAASTLNRSSVSE